MNKTIERTTAVFAALTLFAATAQAQEAKEASSAPLGEERTGIYASISFYPEGESYRDPLAAFLLVRVCVDGVCATEHNFSRYMIDSDQICFTPYSTNLIYDREQNQSEEALSRLYGCVPYIEGSHTFVPYNSKAFGFQTGNERTNVRVELRDD